VTGTITRMIREKYFGWIHSPATGRALFFHKDDVVGGAPSFEQLLEGASVTFTPRETPKGPRADQVRLLDTLL
jgi:CspA family cold shock protein